MRINQAERQIITRAIAAKDREASVYLFGSRVDDTKKGGDLDLLVLSGKIDLWAKLDILATLHQQLGDQKIDLIVYPDLSKPFARLAVNEGILL